MQTQEPMEEEELSPILIYILENRKNLAYSCFFAFLILLSVIKALGYYRQNRNQELVEIQKTYQEFSSQSLNSSQKKGHLEKLEKLLDSHDELKGKYDALIAQSLLLSQVPEKADIFLSRALKRIKSSHYPYHAKYAQISLLLTKSEWNQALQETLKLQDALKDEKVKDPSNFSYLIYTFNLMRVAFLYQKLKQKEEESIAWQELKKSLNNPNIMDSEKILQNAINQAFKKNSISLLDYIEYRQKALSL